MRLSDFPRFQCFTNQPIFTQSPIRKIIDILRGTDTFIRKCIPQCGVQNIWSKIKIKDMNISKRDYGPDVQFHDT